MPRLPRLRRQQPPLGTPAAYAPEVLGTFVLVLFIILAVSGTAPEPVGTGDFN